MVFMESSSHATPVPSRVPRPCHRLVREGRQVKQTALDLGIQNPEVTLHNLAATGRYRPRPPAGTKQSGICRAPRGARPCPPARAGDRDPPPGRDVARRGGRSCPKKGAPGDRPTRRRRDPTSTCCRLLGVSRQGYYRYRKRPTSATELRRRWLTGLIREIPTSPPAASTATAASTPSSPSE